MTHGNAAGDPDAVFPNGRTRRSERAQAFLSRGLEELVEKRARTGRAGDGPQPAKDFDLVIVGSGYGAAVAAATLAGSRLPTRNPGEAPQIARIALLERGTERLPGSFPERFADLPGEVRFHITPARKARGPATGLFDFRVGPDLSALVGNGLGGGSLINAGVMLEPRPEVFGNGRWPRELAGPGALADHFERARRLLGASLPQPPAAGGPDEGGDAAGFTAWSDNTIERAGRSAAKFDALKSLGQHLGRTCATPITIQLTDGPDHHALKAARCNFCGDCVTGCNFNAKLSLDLTALASAARQPGFSIYTGVTVIRFDKHPQGGWKLFVAYTEPALRDRLRVPIELTCDKLILGAGAYGSTELMMRSQARSEGRLKFTKRVGKGFSGNGDTVAAIADLPFAANNAGSETIAPALRQVGPVITGMIDLREEPPGIAIQELAIPASLRRLLAETMGLVRVTAALDDPAISQLKQSDEICTVTDDLLARSMVFAVMGDDGGSGELSLLDGDDQGDLNVGDGAVSMRWSDKARPRRDFYDAQMAALDRMAAGAGGGAKAYANPVWRPFGAAAATITGERDGSLITVHPLGGCPMGQDATSGAVDHLGRVFLDGPAGEQLHHEGLVVLDGSTIPGAIGINPALTIAALSLRASETLADSVWGWLRPGIGPKPPSLRRPVVRHVSATTVSAPSRPTRLELIERLVGPATLVIDGRRQEVRLELTLRSEPFGPRPILRSGAGRVPLRSTPAPLRQERRPASSFLRIYLKADWEKAFEAEAALDERRKTGKDAWLATQLALATDPEGFRDSIASVKAVVGGNIDLLYEVPSSAWRRAWHGWQSWLPNTGWRSLWQRFQDWRDDPHPGASVRSLPRLLRSWFVSLNRMMKHAGRERRMDYSLTVHPPSIQRGPLQGLLRAGAQISGHKTLRYSRRSNPWRQLMEVDLQRFPGLAPRTSTVLSLDLGYLAWTRSPLLCIVDEADQPEGLADLVAFVAHAGRRVLLHHYLSFVRPDDPRPAARATPAKFTDRQQAQPVDDVDRIAGGNRHRLPGPLAGLLHEQLVIQVAQPTKDNGGHGAALLTRYRKPSAPPAGRPVLMIHGYSASGTTYAHASLAPSCAGFLAQEGYDVWVLDLRSSCGLGSATHPWSFENLAFEDIPQAIATVLQQTRRDKIDVVAHCMGAVMFSMAVLNNEGNRYKSSPPVVLSEAIDRVVLSQAGPVMKFRGPNLFRAYLMSALRFVLPLQGFQFSPADPTDLQEQLLDRLLTTLPYPDDSEFGLETPTWRRTPWTRIRHRMDAIYGKAFSLRNLSPEVLRNLDTFFGPMNTRTIEQSLWFARDGQIADTYGSRYELSRKTFPALWPFRTLWLHGKDNGIFDPLSAVMMQRMFDESRIDGHFTPRLFGGLGHQDSLIGTGSLAVFECIAEHLAATPGRHSF